MFLGEVFQEVKFWRWLMDIRKLKVIGSLGTHAEFSQKSRIQLRDAVAPFRQFFDSGVAVEYERLPHVRCIGR